MEYLFKGRSGYMYAPHLGTYPLKERSRDMSFWVEMGDEFIDFSKVVNYWFTKTTYDAGVRYHLYFIFEGIKDRYSINLKNKQEKDQLRAFLKEKFLPTRDRNETFKYEEQKVEKKEEKKPSLQLKEVYPDNKIYDGNVTPQPMMFLGDLGGNIKLEKKEPKGYIEKFDV